MRLVMPRERPSSAGSIVISLALTFAAAWLLVFLRAFQQLNVTQSRYLWVVPTSFVYAFAEVLIVVTVARSGFHIPLILTVGLGYGLGAVAAMLLHHRLFRD